MTWVWLFFRCLRWLLWLSYAVLSAEFIANRDHHLDQFGHIVPTTEALMFALPLAAMAGGFLELMIRERAGLPRPAIGRNWSSSKRPNVPQAPEETSALPM
jgi:hypothetical protein